MGLVYTQSPSFDPTSLFLPFGRRLRPARRCYRRGTELKTGKSCLSSAFHKNPAALASGSHVFGAPPPPPSPPPAPAGGHLPTIYSVPPQNGKAAKGGLTCHPS